MQTRKILDVNLPGTRIYDIVSRENLMKIMIYVNISCINNYAYGNVSFSSCHENFKNNIWYHSKKFYTLCLDS